MSLKETLSRSKDTDQNIERSSDEILADMIEKFVNNQNSTADRQGGNKKCYIANGYVLLAGRFKEENLKKQMDEELKLK